MKATRTVAVAAGIAALALGIYGAWHVRQHQTQSPFFGQSETSRVVVPSWRLADGQAHSWNFHIESLAKSYVQGMLQSQNTQSQDITQTIDGTVHLFLTKNENGFLVGPMKIEISRFDAGGTEKLDPQQLERFKAEIQGTFEVAYDKDNGFFSLGHDPKLTTPSVNFLRSIAHLFQVNTPSSDAQGSFPSTWELRENLAQGIQNVSYALHVVDGSTFAVKRRSNKSFEVRSHTANTVNDLHGPQAFPNDEENWSFDRSNGLMRSGDGHRLLDVKLGAQLMGHEELKWNMVYMGPSDKIAFVRNGNWVNTRSTDVLDDDQNFHNRQAQEIIGRRSPEAILTEWLAIAPSDDIDKKDYVYKSLRSLLILHPEYAENLKKLMASLKGADWRFGAAAEALRTGGGVPGQKVLVALAKDRNDDMASLQVLVPTLGFVEKSTVETEDYLRKLSFDMSRPELAANASLSLGTLLGNLAHEDPSRSEALYQDILNHHAQLPQSDANTAQLLSVVGNSGVPQVLELARKSLASPSENVRGEAVQSLRFVRGAESENMILKSMTEDAKPEIREKAANSLSFRIPTPEGLEVMKTAFEKEEDYPTRKTMLENLWQCRTWYPQMRDYVLQVSKSDRSTDIAEEAHKLVALAEAEFAHPPQ